MKPSYEELLNLIKRVREEIDEFDVEEGYCVSVDCFATTYDTGAKCHAPQCLWSVIDKAIYDAEHEHEHEHE